MNERTIRVHFIDGSERIVPAKDFHWHEEGAQSATAMVDGREVPVYKRSEPEWGPLWYEQLPLTTYGEEDALDDEGPSPGDLSAQDELDETGTHPPNCRCSWCEPPDQAAIDREYRIALREGGFFSASLRRRAAMHNPTTLHGFEQFLRNGGRYHSSDGSRLHTLFFQDGRFYVQRGQDAPTPFTTVGMAIVALLVAIGQVEVQG